MIAAMPKAVLCDLDGTLATISGRNPYESDKCESDLPNWPVIECVRAMYAAGYAVIFMSGRTEKDRAPTTRWIDRYLHILGSTTIPYVLHMRETDDVRPDNVVKVEMFNRHVKDRYDVLFVLDDRKKVVRAWREDLGLTCFAVNSGFKEKGDCAHCDGTGVSSALVGAEAEAATALCALTSMPSWEPHGAASERAVKALVKAVSRARMR